MRPPRFRRILRALLVVLSMCACGTVDDLMTDAGVDAGEPDSGLQDAGIADAGSSDTGHGLFCAPCIQQADCGSGNLCLGETGHCAIDCETTACPSGSTCEPIFRGKIAPLHQCKPTIAACGTLTELAASMCNDGWTAYANGFFGTYCRGCHTSGFDTPAEVRAQADSVRMAIDQRSMPRGVSLDPAERLRILTWLSCGSASPPSSH